MANDRLFIVCKECAEEGLPRSIVKLSSWMVGWYNTIDADTLEGFLDQHEWCGLDAQPDKMHWEVGQAFTLIGESEFYAPDSKYKKVRENLYAFYNKQREENE
jgi:hypothetical protein